MNSLPNFAETNATPADLCHDHVPRPRVRYEKSATLVSNSCASASPVKTVVEKAWRMFTSHAYLHQYDQHGVEREDFIGCFARAEQIIKNYEELAVG
jgi:hypothetical protein